MELFILNIIGTIAFALAGYIVSSRANYDILGITFITFISAFGGGATRDILIGKTPGVFLDGYSLIVVVIVIIMAFVLNYHHSENLENNKLFVIADTIGLSVFAYTGAMAALSSGLNLGGVVFLSLFSAIGGGLLRDVIMNKEAYALKEDFYGIIAVLVGVLVYIVSLFLNFENFNLVAISFIILFGICIRFLAIKFDWHLPKIIKE
jgi:uncharacterized membrane protein YeiH